MRQLKNLSHQSETNENLFQPSENAKPIETSNTKPTNIETPLKPLTILQPDQTDSQLFISSLKKLDKPLDLDCSLFTHLITSEMRSKIIDWLLGVTISIKASFKTFHLCVKLLDLFLCRSPSLFPIDLYKASIACFVIAFKYEENKNISIKTVSEQVTQNFMSQAEILAFEWKVLHVVEFQIFVPTVYDFIEELMQNEEQGIECARFLRDACVYDVDIMSKASHKVAEAIFLISVRRKAPTQGLIALCIQEIKRLVENLQWESFSSLFGRYEREVVEKVWE